MDILNKDKYKDSFIKDDYLQLVYPLIECKQFEGQIEGYNNFFDKLDNEINSYTNVKSLYIETDFISYLPENVMKFKNLISLRVSGSRFWDLNMEQVPTTVKYLSFIEHSNLANDCVKGMERLVNLEILIIDEEPFRIITHETNYNEEYEEIIPVVDLPKLKTIFLDKYFNMSIFEGDCSDEHITNNPFFNNIRHRIDKIKFLDYKKKPLENIYHDYCSFIMITLK